MQGSSSDRKMIGIIRKFIPVRGNRVTTFTTNTHLNKLRLYQSDAVPHLKGSTDDNKMKICALCSSTNKKGKRRKTNCMCKTCGVALCITPVDGVVCYDEWHTKCNLNVCHNDAQKRLKANMEKNHNSAQAIQARMNGRLKQKNTSSGDTAQSSG